MANPEQSGGTLTTDADALTKVVVDWLRTELEDAEIVETDNFLDVGGHSLTFARMNRFLAAGHGVELDIQDVYDKSLADAAGSARSAAHQS